MLRHKYTHIHNVYVYKHLEANATETEKRESDTQKNKDGMKQNPKTISLWASGVDYVKHANYLTAYIAYLCPYGGNVCCVYLLRTQYTQIRAQKSRVCLYNMWFQKLNPIFIPAHYSRTHAECVFVWVLVWKYAEELKRIRTPPYCLFERGRMA